MAGILDRLRRLASSDEELESQERRRTAEQAGACPVHRCDDRARVTVRGRLDSVTLSPHGEPPQLVAELDDGSGRVTLVWMGRRTVAGIRAGTTLEATGRVLVAQGERRMYNPRYVLLQVPH